MEPIRPWVEDVRRGRARADAEQNVINAVLKAHALGTLQPELVAAAEELEREQQS